MVGASALLHGAHHLVADLAVPGGQPGPDADRSVGLPLAERDLPQRSTGGSASTTPPHCTPGRSDSSGEPCCCSAATGLAAVAGAAASYERRLRHGRLGFTYPATVPPPPGQRDSRGRAGAGSPAQGPRAWRPEASRIRWKAALAITRSEVRDLVARPPDVLLRAADPAAGDLRRRRSGHGPFGSRTLLTPGSIADQQFNALNLLVCLPSALLHGRVAVTRNGTGTCTRSSARVAGRNRCDAAGQDNGERRHGRPDPRSPRWSRVRGSSCTTTSSTTVRWGTISSRSSWCGVACCCPPSSSGRPWSRRSSPSCATGSQPTEPGSSILVYTIFRQQTEGTPGWLGELAGAELRARWSDMGAFSLHGTPILLNRLLLPQPGPAPGRGVDTVVSATRLRRDGDLEPDASQVAGARYALRLLPLADAYRSCWRSVLYFGRPLRLSASRRE